MYVTRRRSLPIPQTVLSSSVTTEVAPSAIRCRFRASWIPCVGVERRQNLIPALVCRTPPPAVAPMGSHRLGRFPTAHGSAAEERPRATTAPLAPYARSLMPFPSRHRLRGSAISALGARDDEARVHSRALGLSALSAALMLTAGGAHAEDIATSYFAGGNFSFLEKQFADLKYAGVQDVTPGFLGEDHVEGVKVDYNASRIGFEQLVRTYWKYVQPTQSDGQFSEKGTQYKSAIWVADDKQRAFVEDTIVKLDNSGIFGKNPIVTQVLDAPPTSFETAEEDRLMVLKTKPKSVQKLVKSRDAYFKDHWGFVQFCKDKVCGYVRFAPKCTGDCEDVFPEYRERNFGVPELDASVKITSK